MSSTLVVDHHGRSPIHYLALNCGSVETLNALEPQKSDVEAEDHFGKTPRDYAQENGFSILDSKMREIIVAHFDEDL